MPDAVGSSTSGTAGAQWDPNQSQLDPSLTKPKDPFGQDMFLKLMVAQLKYQNPASPMDSSEFMAQTAQFTTVEKLNEMAEAVTESLSNDRMGTATAMIGRDVTALDDSGEPATSQVTSVSFTPTGPLLTLTDGREVGLADVQGVSAPQSTSPQST